MKIEMIVSNYGEGDPEVELTSEYDSVWVEIKNNNFTCRSRLSPESLIKFLETYKKSKET